MAMLWMRAPISGCVIALNLLLSIYWECFTPPVKMMTLGIPSNMVKSEQFRRILFSLN